MEHGDDGKPSGVPISCLDPGIALAPPPPVFPLWAGARRWLRGARAPNGDFFGIPSNANIVLRLNGIGEISTIGDPEILEGATPPQHHSDTNYRPEGGAGPVSRSIPQPGPSAALPFASCPLRLLSVHPRCLPGL